MIEALISSKTRIKLLLKFFLNSSNRAYLRGLEEEFGESTNAIRLELNKLEKAGMVSSGYALIEAMACGCIPVVTNIPSFKKITANGSAGFLFEPGNIPSLLQVLQHSSSINRLQYTAAVIEHFRKELSFKKIADDLLEVCLSVKSV